jgi:hypothetical protein
MTLPTSLQGSRLASPDLRRSSAQSRRRDVVTLIIEQTKMHGIAYHKFLNLIY